MPKDKQNGNNSRHTSKLGNAIRNKRTAKRNIIADDSSNDNAITDDVNRINQHVADESNDDANGSGGSENNGDGVTSGSGESGSRNGRSGRNSSSGDSDNRTDSGTTRRRGRRTNQERIRELAEQNSISIEEATAQIQAQKKPRRVTKLVDEVESGVTASALLLGAVAEGASELIALSAGKAYLKLQKPEGYELGDAILQVLDTLPKSARKRFDKFIAMYYPYWNLAKVVTKISYPRYLMYQMEKENAHQAKGQNIVETESSSNHSGIETTIGSENTNYDVAAANFG